MPVPRVIANSGPRELTIGDQQERSDLSVASGHAAARNNAVAKVLCYLSVMRGAGRIPDGARALVAHPDVAVPQDFQATGGNEAAHVLPGCLSIKENPSSKPKGVWEFAPDEKQRAEIRALFETTHDLPASFNKADSAAETRRAAGPPGLKQVFAQCCQYVLDQHAPRLRSGEVVAAVDRPVVLGAYQIWTQGSLAAYQLAAFRKTGRIQTGRPADVLDSPRTDPLRGALNEWTAQDLAARTRDQGRTVSGAKSTVEEFSDQERFLRAYARAAANGFPLSEAVIGRIELPFGRKMPDWFVPNTAA